MIPTGLTIIEGSITGVQQASAGADEIGYTVAGQTVTWTAPRATLPVHLRVSVIVDEGQAIGTVFDNTALVEGIPTNTTYHEYTSDQLITEEYYLYTSGPTATKLDQDLTAQINLNANYSVQGPTDALGGYIYYGYAIDDGSIVTAQPPAPIINGVTGNHTIKLYYISRYTTVTVHYVDENGGEIKLPDSLTVIPGTDFYLPMRSFDSINAGGVTYTYFDYARADDGVSLSGAAIPPGAAKTPGASPAYPDLAAPAFTNVTGNKDITLYFTTMNAVVVHFVEKANPLNILRNDMTYFVSSPAFNPAGVTRDDNGAARPLTYDIDLTGVNGKIYGYANSFSVNGGAAQSGNPAAQNAPCEITLYFETEYAIIEKFSDTNGDAVDDDLTHTGLPRGYVFYAMDDEHADGPPDEIGEYVYLGYRFSDNRSPLISGKPPKPLINGVFWDDIIIYVYESVYFGDLPDTGGIGLLPFAAAGFALIGLAAVMFATQKRGRYRNRPYTR